ncbi:UBX domain-containing protein 11 [Aplochiton taeniatus]
MITTGAPPSDFELMSSMVKRLTLLEAKVKTQAMEIEHKGKTIAVLEETLKHQKSKESKSGSSDEDDVFRKCQRLQAQVLEMERFLSDYGMIWVGDTENQHNACEKQVQSQSLEQDHWQPDTSVLGNFFMNFDLVLQNIKELNILAGEGESFVSATPRGGRFVQRDPIQLKLYKNGILMFNGPFRSYKELCTQQCMQDLMDGYFPSELKGRFPDGVPFAVYDNRDEVFQERQPWAEFPGKGQAVQAETTKTELSLNNLNRKLTMDQFLNKLPKVVVKAGRVIDIRDSVKASLQGSSDHLKNPKVTLIETPLLQTMRERLDLHDSDRPPSACDVTTLRVKSEDGEQTYILKMRFSETIRHLRQYLDKHRGEGMPAYDIISVFPQRCYGEDHHTLLSCHLTPNAALLLRTQLHSH